MVVALVLLVALFLFFSLLTSDTAKRQEAPSDTGAQRLAEWRLERAERRRAAARLRAQRRLPPLPADDAPPSGLPPLVPSPRVLAAEVAQGISDLERWLGEHRPPGSQHRAPSA